MGAGLFRHNHGSQWILREETSLNIFYFFYLPLILQFALHTVSFLFFLHIRATDITGGLSYFHIGKLILYNIYVGGSWEARPDFLSLNEDVLFLEQVGKSSILAHLNNDVVATNELLVDVELGDGGPLAVLLNARSELRVLKNIVCSKL